MSGLDLALVAEIGARRARLRVDRDQSGVVRAHEDPAAAGSAVSGLIVDPMRDAAAIVTVARPLRVGDFRVKSPFLRAGAGIERDHLVEGRAENEAVLDEQRRRLELRTLHRLRRAAVEIAGAIFPGAHEVCDIGRRDLIEFREFLAALVAAPMIPGIRGGCGRRRHQTASQQQKR